jgi:hypothetical protein
VRVYVVGYSAETLAGLCASSEGFLVAFVAWLACAEGIFEQAGVLPNVYKAFGAVASGAIVRGVNGYLRTRIYASALRCNEHRVPMWWFSARVDRRGSHQMRVLDVFRTFDGI